jgi:hypothetical protein
MTEEQIERRAEHLMDKLDSAYMNGNMTEANYKKEVKAIDKWVNQQMKRIPSLSH